MLLHGERNCGALGIKTGSARYLDVECALRSAAVAPVSSSARREKGHAREHQATKYDVQQSVLDRSLLQARPNQGKAKDWKQRSVER